MKQRIMYTALFTIMALLLVSCGYKPSSHLVKHVFSENIYVEVLVDRAEPENASFVKDEINRLIYTRFKGRVTSKEKAQSQIRISYAGSSFLPLAYENGYVTRYRANIRVHFNMLTKEGKFKKTISSMVEADIQASSLTSSALRTEAIRKGLAKALDEFLAYVSAKGMLKSER
ncbi:MAG: LPS assembly lipoprotein LptE [Sulfurovum sp.]|nr:LPS assembly lipoprotein LptE [Sulfurovum sp.]